MEQLPRLYLSRADMLKRVARFKALKGSDGGLPDSKMPGCERTLFNVIGFRRRTLARTRRRRSATSRNGRHQDPRRLQPRLLQG